MAVDHASRTQISKLIPASVSLFAAGVMGCIAFTVVAIALGISGKSLGMVFGYFAGVVSFPFWLAGVCLVGWPLWKFMAHRGHRSSRVALMSGGLAAMVSAPLIAWALFTNMNFTVGVQGALTLAVIAIPAAAGGVASGWTFWHLYGQVHAS